LYIYSIWAFLEGWGAWNAQNKFRGLAHLSSRLSQKIAGIELEIQILTEQWFKYDKQSLYYSQRERERERERERDTVTKGIELAVKKIFTITQGKGSDISECDTIAQGKGATSATRPALFRAGGTRKLRARRPTVEAAPRRTRGLGCGPTYDSSGQGERPHTSSIAT
jgi:hypothetical protein